MRRLLIVLVTCLGLTIAVSGVAHAAKKSTPLPALAFVGDPQAAATTPDAQYPDLCRVSLQWEAAPTAPKGYALRDYWVAFSTTPDPTWEELSAQTFTSSAGDALVEPGTTYYINVRAAYDKVKGKYAETYTPYGDGAGPYTWAC